MGNMMLIHGFSNVLLTPVKPEPIGKLANQLNVWEIFAHYTWHLVNTLRSFALVGVNDALLHISLRLKARTHPSGVFRTLRMCQMLPWLLEMRLWTRRDENPCSVPITASELVRWFSLTLRTMRLGKLSADHS